MSASKFLAITLAVVCSTQGTTRAEDLEHLLSKPATYHGKRVTTTGLAYVGGAEFFLYRNVHELREGDPAISVTWDLNRGPIYEAFNNHWVRVTGIVDAQPHGLLGEGRCAIRAERVEALPLPAIPDSNIYGIFRNESPYVINIKFADVPSEGIIFGLSPGKVTSPVCITEGTAVAIEPSGKIVAKGDLIPAGSKRYFDSKTRTYHYLIKDGKIQLVAPVRARKRNFHESKK